MKKSIIYLTLLFCLLVICATVGTYAWFNSQATAENNVFESGELVIGIPNPGINNGFISSNNLVPGQSVSSTIDVKNLGDVLFKYKISCQKSDGDELLYNKLDVKINNGISDIYNGALKNLNNINIGNVDAKGIQTLNVTVTLPGDSDNQYQGKISTAKFIFDATQVENESF